MEKRIAHFRLDSIHTLVSANQFALTHSARSGMSRLQCDRNDLKQVLLALTRKDFYKSMTSHADHRLWQDVYRPQSRFGHLYIKLTVVEKLLIISFKEL